MSTNRELRKLAEQLPPLPRLDKNGEIITQKYLIYEYRLTEMGKGFKHPTEQGMKPLMINHFDELRKCYNLGGKQAVAEYVLHAKAMAEAFAEDLKKQAKEKKPETEPVKE